MPVSTWFAAKAGNCTSFLCPANGKGVSARRFATSKRWSGSSKNFLIWNGSVCRSERSKTVFRRLLGYAEKIFQLSTQVIDRVGDHRSLPRICTSLVVKAVLAVYWTRLGSLNALAMTRAAKFWKSWLDGPLCSADSLGRIVADLEGPSLRQGIHHVYERLNETRRCQIFTGWRWRCWMVTRPAPAIAAGVPDVAATESTRWPQSGVGTRDPRASR